MTASASVKRGTVRDFNNKLRQLRTGGTIVITSGIRALNPEFLLLVERAVAQFDAFTNDNDPFGEHDFGAVQILGRTVFFKIDCYDLNLQCHSPDPADPSVTHRVMTLMLAEEY